MLDPLTIERIEAAASETPILIALSGGGDSVALLHLLADRFGAKRVRAAIVDHKLREGSRADAERALQIADAVGIGASLLDLSWPKSANRAHETARALRYGVLCAHARALGARVIVTGHTRDDQAETVLIRASRGSGLRGLAGMRAFAPAPVWPEGRGLWLARPLLLARRSDLRAFLAERGASWLEDPANENEIYARVRARRSLADLQDLDPMRFAALAERLKPHMDELDRRADELIAAAVEFRDDEMSCDRAHWRGEDIVAQRALEVLILAASGEQRGPSAAQLGSVCSALSQESFSGATLGGAWLQRRGARVVIRRDPGALAGRAGGAGPIAPLPLPRGEETVWDGRLALTSDEEGWAVIVEDGRPLLARDDERASISLAHARWLLRDRVEHLLSR